MKPFVVANPCHEDWSAMRRDSASLDRHCAACDTRVYDLAAMTEAEIRGLVTVSGGRFCGRQLIVAGSLVVKPPPATPRSRFTLRMIAGGAVVASALASAACSPVPDVHAGPPTPVEPRTPEPSPSGNPGPAPVAPAPAPTPAGGVEGSPIEAPIEAPIELQKVGEMPYIPELERSLEFAAGKSKLTRATKKTLDDVAAFLRRAPHLGQLRIVGHASGDEGDADQRQALALARANAVRCYLVAHGVAASRLDVGAYHAQSGADHRVLLSL